MRKPQKKIGSFWQKTFFSFWPISGSFFWCNRLDIARCKTTGSWRLYGVERIVLVCNAQEELVEQY